MLPLDYLTDERIADALNYTRNSWGNKPAMAIQPSQVKKLRNYFNVNVPRSVTIPVITFTEGKVVSL